MNRLQSELQRLYAIPPVPAEVALPPRALVLELARPADWSALSAVWVGVQADLALPAPAIAINGVDAYQLWFSLAEAAEPAQAQAFLDALCQRYLADIVQRRPQRLSRWPRTEGGLAAALPALPREQGDSGLWSAFVAPDLAAVFGDEPWLDLPPGIEAQADQLSRLSPIQAADFERALAELQSEAAAAASGPLAPSASPAGLGATPPAHAASLPAPPALQLADLPVTQDPRAFLLSVMNHPGLDLAWRLDAAKALLGSA
ncbi:hypothetical protein PSQ20_07070 [Curvibacter sp. RS43]|uniref:hypothetical protein n=1 Tax=Curvibacter microcysteis TaxID=3026419 RepID=UPI0023601EDF|nr:hypothetical protein [Curvibacter sp. RS43]MDD0810092.1 hypothetical protein [Curvibacter sp. RS43]